MRLIKVFAEPSYLLGRFHAVRRAYGLLRAGGQAIGPRSSEVRLFDLYGPEFVSVPIRASGLVISKAGPQTHLHELARASFSSGVALITEAAAELRSDACAAPLRGVNASGLTYRDLQGRPDVRSRDAILTVPDSRKLSIIQAVAGDPLLVDVVGGHIGYRPRRVECWFFWSLANELTLSEREGLSQTVRFHYDVHGLNFVYVSFYLTNASAQSGAHVLIEGTHRSKTVRQLLGSVRIDDANAERFFGAARIRVVEGAAGEGFFEDASCYHKALAPVAGDRLMLQLRYR
jgi:hypothetical protein